MRCLHKGRWLTYRLLLFCSLHLLLAVSNSSLQSPCLCWFLDNKHLCRAFSLARESSFENFNCSLISDWLVKDKSFETSPPGSWSSPGEAILLPRISCKMCGQSCTRLSLGKAEKKQSEWGAQACSKRILTTWQQHSWYLHTIYMPPNNTNKSLQLMNRTSLLNDPERPIQLESYFSICIRREMSKYPNQFYDCSIDSAILAIASAMAWHSNNSLLTIQQKLAYTENWVHSPELHRLDPRESRLLPQRL